MSQAKIKAALELKLNSILPLVKTAFENVKFEPVSTEPYQVATVLFSQPENPTQGDGFYRERGFMQVSVRFPVGNGAGEALARAELLKAVFHRGLSLEREGVTTHIDRTPEIGSGSTEGNRYIINVRIRFYANIFGA